MREPLFCKKAVPAPSAKNSYMADGRGSILVRTPHIKCVATPGRLHFFSAFSANSAVNHSSSSEWKEASILRTTRSPTTIPRMIPLERAKRFSMNASSLRVLFPEILI
jgi:hypothetical protein